MLVFVNGQFVPEEQAVVSVFDRGFLYGDGVFEAMRVVNGKPFRWEQHLERLQRGAEFLKIRLPWPSDSCRGFADQLIAENRQPDCLLRIAVSRGVGARGYSPKGVGRPSLVMSLHQAPPIDLENPPVWRVVTSSFRLPANEPLAQFKTCNKLPQILARAEADAAGADEALLLNTLGDVAEGSSSNLFWVEGETIRTPPLASGLLPGVTRAVVGEICRGLRQNVIEKSIRPEQLRASQGVFFSLTSLGIAEAGSLDGCALPRSALVREIFAAYWELVRVERR